MSSSSAVVQVCKSKVAEFSNDCSGFAKAVALECGVLLTGGANEIVENYIIGSSAWNPLQTEQEAIAHAKAGKLVLAGKKAAGNGHVAIVVDVVNSDHPARAYVYMGRYHVPFAGGPNVGVLTLGHSSITLAWRASDLKLVRFASIQPSKILMPPAGGDARYHL